MLATATRNTKRFLLGHESAHLNEPDPAQSSLKKIKGSHGQAAKRNQRPFSIWNCVNMEGQINKEGHSMISIQNDDDDEYDEYNEDVKISQNKGQRPKKIFSKCVDEMAFMESEDEDEEQAKDLQGKGSMSRSERGANQKAANKVKGKAKKAILDDINELDSAISIKRAFIEIMKKEALANNITIQKILNEIIFELQQENVILDEDAMVKLLEISHQYNIMSLTEICEENLMMLLKMENLVKLTKIAEHFHLPNLRVTLIRFASDNYEFLKEKKELKDIPTSVLVDMIDRMALHT